MSKVSEFYSINEVKKLPNKRVYHNNDACPAGRDIPTNERLDGTNNHRLCKDCAELNK